jgi:hypothetical protein
MCIVGTDVKEAENYRLRNNAVVSALECAIMRCFLYGHLIINIAVHNTGTLGGGASVW